VNTQIPDPVFPCYIALGTNLGDRSKNLENAIQLLSSFVEVVAQSPIYQTIPWGFADQPDFLNQVIFVKTAKRPDELLQLLKQIEVEIGRTPTFQNGPRIVDLDILFYDDWVVENPGLQIPHPRLHERAFVLVPLSDLNPSLWHPVLAVTVQEMLHKVDSTGVTRFTP